MTANVAKPRNPYQEALTRFTWGLPIRGHEVGPYRIVEYHPRVINGSTVTREIDQSDVSFHLFIEGDSGEIKDCCHTFHSLDAALAGGIAYRAEGCNHRADSYFMLAIEAVRSLPK